ncbi:DUF4166 domain-containing protein [Candidatus Gracilibacteria bacterium]|nr:DUF4166 domain-containing protein [Candidatus Gracilibacteria bacterium]
MTSIYQQLLGTDFARLHPQIQRRFGFSSADGVACIGRGVMHEVWHGAPYTLPFLYVGTWRRIMFPEQGRAIPFTIENYAYVDRYGRETITWLRTFQTQRQRRFDAYMILDQERQCVVDYLGTHQHLAVDVDLTVDKRGGIRLRSGEQRFYEGIIGFRFPLFFSGIADVCEWYDEDQGRFRIEVCVSNRRWGPLFGYHGSFSAHWLSVQPGSVPANARPQREERRGGSLRCRTSGINRIKNAVPLSKIPRWNAGGAGPIRTGDHRLRRYTAPWELDGKSITFRVLTPNARLHTHETRHIAEIAETDTVRNRVHALYAALLPAIPQRAALMNGPNHDRKYSDRDWGHSFATDNTGRSSPRQSSLHFHRAGSDGCALASVRNTISPTKPHKHFTIGY